MKILTSIPWFVWLLFGYVIFTGVKALHSQVLSIKKIFIVPMIFLYMGINGLMKQNQPIACVAIWLGFFASAAYIIWRWMQPLKVVCDRQKGLIRLPGNWTTLVLLLSIFVSKFTFGFLSATHPELKSFFLFCLTELSISGIICGISSGRFISLLMKFFKSSHVNLQESD
jgi:hypothetical protein